MGNKEKQITINKTIDGVTTEDTILEKNYWRVKIKLERIGYKVSKCDTNEKTTK